MSPRSTLFPYTTLFRSRRRPRSVRADVGDRVRGGPAGRTGPDVGLQPLLRTRRRRDRKSTRLNSSHANISYAVFCLKKEKLALLRHPNFIHKSRLHFVG